MINFFTANLKSAWRYLPLAATMLLFHSVAIAQPALHEPFGAATGTSLVTTGLGWANIGTGIASETSMGNLLSV